jgi:HK97 family phage major capsid protein
MTKEEQELLEKVNQEAGKAVDEKMKTFAAEYKEIATKAAEGKMDKKSVDEALLALETKSQEFTNLELKKVNDELDKVKEELIASRADLKALKENPKQSKEERMGFGTLLRKSLEKDGLLEEITVDSLTGKKALVIKGWDRKDVKLQTKAAIDMTTALGLIPGSTPGTSIGYLTDYKMKDVLINLTKDIHAVQFLPTDPIINKYMGVLVEYSYYDGSAVKTEGNAAAKSSLKFKTIEFKAFEYATYFRVSKENLADIPRLESKLNRIAPDKILSTLDSAIFATGGDNSTSAYGMYYAGNYTAFDATDLGTVDSANVVDLIGKMVLQAQIADQDVNTVILHPAILNGVRQEKDQLGNSIANRNMVFDAYGNVVSIWGLTVVPNKKQTVNRVTVMWNEAAEIGLLEDINFEIGTDGTDLTEGMRTIVFWMRAAFGVGKPGAIFLSSDPDTDIATITKS